MEFQRQRLHDLNVLYKENEKLIDSVQSGLRREIPLLIQEFKPSLEQTAALDEYINDRITLFRFLRKNNYSLPHTLSLLVDNLRWRLREHIETFTFAAVKEPFFDAPYCFFSDERDGAGRPVLVIQLSQLPEAPPNADLKEFFAPFVIYMLETIRKVTLDISLSRIAASSKDPIMTDILVLVDFKDARPLPKDRSMLQAFAQLLRRYPLSAGTVCLLNFGWIYQGLWQMVKLLLTEEAKNRVAFPKVKELYELMPDSKLVKELEGKKPVQWDLSMDTVFSKYGYQSLPSPPSSPLITPSSRRGSSASISTVYYDTFDTQTVSRSPSSLYLPRLQPLTPHHRRPSINQSLYATPTGGMTPVASHSNLVGLARAYSGLDEHKGKRMSSIPPRLRSTFKAITELLSPTDDEPVRLLSEGVPSAALSERLAALQQRQRQQDADNGSTRRRKRYLVASALLAALSTTERALMVAMVRLARRVMLYRRTLYWVLLCVALKNGIQQTVQNLLVLMGGLLVDQPSMRSGSLGGAGAHSLWCLTTGYVGQLTL
ncbi:hypothetical protein BCR43DRAFT_523614 [Syncephalastrum racemosum]|uniref:CRAL-TRIO domain-containing protein n=1 Tax=Syncephalastrum racemosum TaxID=13706 RepID=A0A1X2HEQ3_SYNRA|nr:hypothetical protein BCR43DRAFT_523614 [Syncephalastrum racemosum]